LVFQEKNKKSINNIIDNNIKNDKNQGVKRKDQTENSNEDIFYEKAAY